MENENMSGSKYSQVLQKIGLAEKEAIVYEILLRDGQLGVAELRALTPYKRGDLYNILYSLRDKNIVEQTIKDSIIQFRPRDPYHVMEYLETQKASLMQASVVMESVLPQMLKEFTLAVERPVVRYYDGTEGLKKIYELLNKSGEKEAYLLRSIYDNKHEEIELLIDQQREKQIKLGINMHALTPMTEKSIEHYFHGIDETRLFHRRFVDPKKFSLPAQIMIWKNTAAIVSMREKIIATVIENRDIATTLKTLFHLIWDVTKPYHDSVTKSMRQ